MRCSNKLFSNLKFRHFVLQLKVSFQKINISWLLSEQKRALHIGTLENDAQPKNPCRIFSVKRLQDFPLQSDVSRMTFRKWYLVE
jgi:hypothetical protein